MHVDLYLLCPKDHCTYVRHRNALPARGTLFTRRHQPCRHDSHIGIDNIGSATLIAATEFMYNLKDQQPRHGAIADGTSINMLVRIRHGVTSSSYGVEVSPYLCKQANEIAMKLAELLSSGSRSNSLLNGCC